MKLEAALADADDLKQQLDLKAQETKNTAATLEQVRSANAELEVRSSPSLLSLFAINPPLSPLNSEPSRLPLPASRAARVLRRRRKTWNVSTRPSLSNLPTLTR